MHCNFECAAIAAALQHSAGRFIIRPKAARVHRWISATRPDRQGCRLWAANGVALPLVDKRRRASSAPNSGVRQLMRLLDPGCHSPSFQRPWRVFPRCSGFSSGINGVFEIKDESHRLAVRGAFV